MQEPLTLEKLLNRLRLLEDYLNTFWFSFADYHRKLCHGSFQNWSICLFISLKNKKNSLCSRTTIQMSTDHQWSAYHRLRTASLEFKSCLESVAAPTSALTELPKMHLVFEFIRHGF